MAFLSQIKNDTVKFITDYSVLTAAAVGYGATQAYSVLNPVGGAILFATFVHNDGLESQTYTHGRFTSVDGNLKFTYKKIKACVMAWSAAYYVTPYANLATISKGFSAVISVPGKLGALISTVASKAFASLLAMPSQMFTTTTFAINSINLPAVAATVAVVVLFVSLYKIWNHLSARSEKINNEFNNTQNAKLTKLEAI